MIYVQSMDLNKLGEMLALGCGGFLIEDAIFLTEKTKDFLRSGWVSMAIPCLISYCGVWVNIICVLGTSCNYQFEIMSLKSSLAIMMV